MSEVLALRAFVPRESHGLEVGVGSGWVGMPGLDAVILSSLLVPECTEIYPTDSHLELYQKKGFKIVNLHFINAMLIIEGSLNPDK